MFCILFASLSYQSGRESCANEFSTQDKTSPVFEAPFFLPVDPCPHSTLLPLTPCCHAVFIPLPASRQALEHHHDSFGQIRPNGIHPCGEARCEPPTEDSRSVIFGKICPTEYCTYTKSKKREAEKRRRVDYGPTAADLCPTWHPRWQDRSRA